MNDLILIRDTLRMILQREFTRLCRLARDAEKHHVSTKTVDAIREEAWQVNGMIGYPHNALNTRVLIKFKYAFKMGWN